MHLEGLYPSLPAYLAAVEARLGALAASDLDTLADATRRAVGGSAKRLRPTLLFLSAEVFAPADERAVEYAAVLEAVHSASLVHDDVIDEADLRRGQASLPALLGSKLAVLVGDYLVSRSLRAAAAEGNLAVIRLLAETAERMSHGQVQELLAGWEDLDETAYLQIVEGKTASLFCCACQVGGVLAGADARQQASLGEYGRRVGIAFQLADDLRDLGALPPDPGKPANHDLALGRATLPLLWTLRQGPDQAADELRQLLPEPDAGERVRALVCKHAGVDHTLALAREHAAAAVALLADLPTSPAREALAVAARLLLPLPVPA